MITNQMVEAVYEWKHYAIRLTGSSDKAKDLLQDVFLKMFVVKERLPDDLCQLRRIAHEAMKNLYIDGLRSANRRGRTVCFIPEFIDDIVENSVYPKLNLEAVNRLIQTKIGRKQRKVFMMHLAGYQPEEISKELRMNMNTVYGYTNQTKVKLKSLFQKI